MKLQNSFYAQSPCNGKGFSWDLSYTEIQIKTYCNAIPILSVLQKDWYMKMVFAFTFNKEIKQMQIV